MLSGAEKAKLLFDLLGDKASSVMSHMRPEMAQKLAANISDSPNASSDDIRQLVEEINYKKGAYVASTPAAPVLQAAPEPEYDLDTSAISPLKESVEDEFDLSAPADAFDLDVSTPEEPRSSQAVSANFPKPVGEIAQLLAKQRPTIIAFFLSNLQDPEKTIIWDHLPIPIQEKVAPIKVEDVPASKAVFDNLYKTIVEDPSFGASKLVAPEGLESMEPDASTSVAIADLQDRPVSEDTKAANNQLQDAFDNLATTPGVSANELAYDTDEDDEEDVVEGPVDINSLSLSDGSDGVVIPTLDFSGIDTESDTSEPLNLGVPQDLEKDLQADAEAVVSQAADQTAQEVLSHMPPELIGGTTNPAVQPAQDSLLDFEEDLLSPNS